LLIIRQFENAPGRLAKFRILAETEEYQRKRILNLKKVAHMQFKERRRPNNLEGTRRTSNIGLISWFKIVL
jgi:hypothetical protein